MSGIGSVHGEIVIEYDSRGIAHARNDVGQFVAMGESSNKRLKSSTDSTSHSFGGMAAGILSASKYLILGSTAAVGLATSLNTVISALIALAPVAGFAVALLPGALASAAGALIIFKAAVAGVGDALSAAASGDAAKFDEALKKLSPSARGAAVAFRDVVTALKPVQQQLQQTFFSGSDKAIAAYAPAVKSLAPVANDVARAMGGIFSELLKAGSTPAVIGGVKNALGGVRDFMYEIEAAVQPVITGLASIAGQSGQFGQDIGSFIGQGLATFGQFLQTVDLSSLLESAMAVLVPIGELLKNIGTIAVAVFGALNADGGSALGTIGELVGKIAEFTQSQAGAAALEALGGAMQQIAGAAGQALFSLLTALAPAVVALAPVVGQLASIIGNVLSQAFTAVAPSLLTLVQALAGALMPILPVVASLLSSLIPPLAMIIGALVSALAPILTALSPIIQLVGQVLSQVLGAALGALMPLIQALLPPLSQLILALLPVLVPIIQLVGAVLMALMPLITLIANLLIALLVPVLKLLTPVIAAIATVLGVVINALIAFQAPITAFFTKMVTVQSLSAIWNAVFSYIKNVVSTVIGWIVTYIQWAAGMWATVFNTIRNVASTIWSAIVASFRGYINMIMAIFNFLGALPGIVGGYFRNMASAAVSAVGSLISFVRGIPGQVLGALGNMASLLYSAGQNIIQGLINGIKNMAGAVKDAVSGVLQTARNLLPFSPAKEGPFSGRGWTLYSGMSMMEGLAEGLERGARAVQEVMAGAVGGLSSTVNVTGSVDAMRGSSASSTPAVVAGGTTLQVTQHNTITGDNAGEAADMVLRRLSFGVRTGTSNVVAAVGSA